MPPTSQRGALSNSELTLGPGKGFRCGCGPAFACPSTSGPPGSTRAAVIPEYGLGCHVTLKNLI